MRDNLQDYEMFSNSQSYSIQYFYLLKDALYSSQLVSSSINQIDKVQRYHQRVKMASPLCYTKKIIFYLFLGPNKLLCTGTTIHEHKYQNLLINCGLIFRIGRKQLLLFLNRTIKTKLCTHI